MRISARIYALGIRVIGDRIRTQGRETIAAEITIRIPDWLERIVVLPALLYRRLRYGYPFRRIPLTQGEHAIVDPEDYYKLMKHKWYVLKNRWTAYAQRNPKFRKKLGIPPIRMHRVILNAPPDLVVDHINFNGLDNRKANLRLATITQNNRHTRGATKNVSSKYKGVSWYSREKRWVAGIKTNRKARFLGQFKDEKQAARAYDNAARKYHKEFAVLNFPDEAG